MQELYAATAAVSSLFQCVRWLEVNKQEILRIKYEKGGKPVIHITPGEPSWEQGEKEGFKHGEIMGLMCVWKII